jgi:hypothetical protein
VAGHSLCKLLGALGDHSTAYLAAHIACGAPVPTAPGAPPTMRGRLVQCLLQLLLVYTGVPGYYGVDEDETEVTRSYIGASESGCWRWAAAGVSEWHGQAGWLSRWCNLQLTRHEIPPNIPPVHRRTVRVSFSQWMICPLEYKGSTFGLLNTLLISSLCKFYFHIGTSKFAPKFSNLDALDLITYVCHSINLKFNCLLFDIFILN